MTAYRPISKLNVIIQGLIQYKVILQGFTQLNYKPISSSKCLILTNFFFWKVRYTLTVVYS